MRERWSSGENKIFLVPSRHARIALVDVESIISFLVIPSRPAMIE